MLHRESEWINLKLLIKRAPRQKQVVQLSEYFLHDIPLVAINLYINIYTRLILFEFTCTAALDELYTPSVFPPVIQFSSTFLFERETERTWNASMTEAPLF